MPNPLADDWALHSLLTGIRRVNGQPPAQKLPVTPDILVNIYHKLNLLSSFDASFWAVCLVSFYGMLRKSHLLSSSIRAFDPSQQLVRSEFHFFSGLPLSLFSGAKPFSSESGRYFALTPHSQCPSLPSHCFPEGFLFCL